MSKYEEIKQRYSPVDSAVRADIHLLLKALELACYDVLEWEKCRIDVNDTRGCVDYWLEMAAKEECPQCHSTQRHKLDCKDESNKNQTVTLKANYKTKGINE